MRRHTAGALAFAGLVLWGTGPAFAGPEEDDSLRGEVDRLRRQMNDMEERHRREMEALRDRLDRDPVEPRSELEREVALLVERMGTAEGRLATTYEGRNRALPVDIALNAQMVVGGSGERDEVLNQLNAGGHDPKGRGFTLQNLELIVSGKVDKYFDAFAYVTMTYDDEGGTRVELEEAFATSTSLPHGLQFKAGQYYTEFGRHNPQHPHQWEFVNMPVTHSRFFGPDGMRGLGAQLAWELPTGTPVRLFGGAQNANGETMTSFVGVVDEDGDHGHEVVESTVGEKRPREVRSIDDLVWSGRAEVSPDVDHDVSTVLGGSVAYGPNSAGDSATTAIWGADLTVRWEPHDHAHHGFPFVEFTGEWLQRDYRFDDFTDEEDGAFVPGGTMRDRGWYAQAVWGFHRPWTLAARYERFASDVDDDHIGLDDRTRTSLALTHYFSGNSNVRLQIDVDDAAALEDSSVWSVWLQFEWELGGHDGHEH